MILELKALGRDNPYELCEAELYETQSVTAYDFSVGFEVTFDQERIFDQEMLRTALIKLRKAVIQVAITGGRIGRQGRAGDYTNPMVEVEQFSNEKKTTRERNASFIAALGEEKSDFLKGEYPLRLGLTGARKVVFEDTSRSSSEFERRRSSLTYKGNGRWVVQDLITETLSGKYAPKDQLCIIEVSQDAGEVKATVHTYPADLDITLEDGESLFLKRGSPKKGLVQALVSKGLRINQGELGQDGRIVISSSTVEFSVPTDEKSEQNI